MSVDLEVERGVVQEDEDVYYIKSVSGDFLHPEYTLFRMDSNTGKEVSLCEMGNEIVILCGIRNHELIYRHTLSNDFPQCLQIYKMDLDTLHKKIHEIEIQSTPLFGGCDCVVVGHRETLCYKDNYPCIDEDGKHIYCRMKAKKGSGKAYVADINLETDTIEPLISLEHGHDWYYDRIDWGVGKSDFIMCDGHDIKDSHTEERCIYYNMATKQKQELVKFEEMVSKIYNRYLPDRICFCCGEGRIFWLLNKQWAKPKGGLLLTEYNISTDEFVERVHLERTVLRNDFDLAPRRIFVSNHYLYIYDYDNFQSWRFSMDDWKPERLEKNGDEYIFVPVEIKA
jgi:hypothetical protein